VWRFLRHNPSGGTAVFARVGRSFAGATNIVKVYYLLSLFISYELTVDVHALAQQPDVWDLLWPVRWLAMFRPSAVIEWLALALVGASFLAFQWPWSRTARTACATLGLLVLATLNSRGAIDHGLHVWLWMGIVFVFLPGRHAVASRAGRMTYLNVFVGAQALVLLFYSMTGVWKVTEGLMAFGRGIEGNFSQRGLALQLADRMLQTGTHPLLAAFAIDHYLLMWPVFLAVMYVEAGSLLVVLRPRLHAPWACALIAMHVGTQAMMAIPFSANVLLLGLLFLMSPFGPERASVVRALGDLPGVGVARSLVRQTRRLA
jgi:hypothetical protein